MPYQFEYQLEQFLTDELGPALEGLMIGLVIFVILALVISLACWIMRSIALTRLGNRRGVAAAWLIWLPIVGCWTIGAIADEYDGRNGIKRRWRIILLVCSILVTALYSCSYSSMVAGALDAALGSSDPSEILGGLLGAMSMLLGGVFFASIAATVQMVCSYICIYKIFESTMPRHAVLCFILSIIIPVAEPICLLIAMNKGYPENSSALPAAYESAPEAQNWYQAQ